MTIDTYLLWLQGLLFDSEPAGTYRPGTDPLEVMVG